MTQESKPDKNLFQAVKEVSTPQQFLKFLVLGTGILFFVFFLGVFGHWLVSGSVNSNLAGDQTESHDHEGGKAQKWSCSMHPQIQKDGPGKCPICAMPLIPIQASSGKMHGLRQMVTSPEARALMEIEVTPVEKRAVETEVRMVGKVDYDETRLKYITAWVSGRLDRLFVDFTGVEVKKGDHLVYIYSEELYAAQQELIEAVNSARENKNDKSIFSTGGINLLESTREKLRLLGLSKKQILAIEKQKKPSDHMTIYSPMGGIVTEKFRKDGDRVKVGDRIYTVADLSQVWVKMDAYESDLVWLRYGQNVTFTTEAYPGETFTGRISFIDPVLNEKTRTVKVRVNVSNSHGKLKPEMFVRGIVKAKVAKGGRVIDPNLAGKWISPMHPEVVRDKPGDCPVCGMSLIRAESLGYTSPASKVNPLVIPVSAPLVTGTRAIVYLEMPSQPAGLEDAFKILAAAITSEKMIDIRAAFNSVEKSIENSKSKTLTIQARKLWDKLSASLKTETSKGRQVKGLKSATIIFENLSEIMDMINEKFVSPDQPTFIGREIVLGPRAGDYYLVKNGLNEGDLIVTRGNFKIDSALQIQAKPSMMTPDGGGGGGGHNHGGSSTKKKTTTSQKKKMDLPRTFRKKLNQLQFAYQDVIVAIKKNDLKQIHSTFIRFNKTLKSIDKKLLSGHPKMLWGELSMLLGNDAFEGMEVRQISDVNRVFDSLQKNMNQLKKKFGSHDDMPQSFNVSKKFQSQLTPLWNTYLLIGKALSGDDYKKAMRASVNLEKALSGIDMKLLTDSGTHNSWMKELKNLKTIQAALKKSKDIKSLRRHFKSLSDEIMVLSVTFGFEKGKKVYQLHCPMAFGNKGAIWLQDNDQTKNPYFGSTMLKCADKVELISDDSQE